MAPPFELRRATLHGELPELARGAVGRARQPLDAVGHLTLLAAQLLEHVVRQLRRLLPLLLEHLELRRLGALLDVLAAQQRRRRGGVVRQVAAVGEVAVEVAQQQHAVEGRRHVVELEELADRRDGEQLPLNLLVLLDVGPRLRHDRDEQVEQHHLLGPGWWWWGGGGLGRGGLGGGRWGVGAIVEEEGGEVGMRVRGEGGGRR